MLHSSFRVRFGRYTLLLVFYFPGFIFTRSDVLLVSASRANCLISITPNARAVFLQIFPIDPLNPPSFPSVSKCTKCAMPEPIRFPLIRRPYWLSHLLIVINVSSRAFLDQLERSIACWSWCLLTRDTESDSWCPKLEICMSSRILCRTDSILRCLLMLPSSAKELIWYSRSRPLV